MVRSTASSKMSRRFTSSSSSTVLFIGEDDEDECQYQPVQNNNSRTRGLVKKTFSNYDSFVGYLFSENSVLVRIFSSLCPPFGRWRRIAVDWEGAFLSVFILTATVYWGLVAKGVGTRAWSLGKATILTAGYLLAVTALTATVSLCTKTAITLRQIFCVIGYGLFGHSLVLLLCEIGSDEWFMSLLTIVGGLDSIRICLILLARTPVPACRFVLCTPVAIIHLLYLVYLHFAIMKG